MPATTRNSSAVNSKPVTRTSRKRKAETAVDDDVADEQPKRRRVGKAPTIMTDDQWLQEAVKEFKKQKYPKSTERHERLQFALLYLPLFQLATKTDGSFFDSSDKARRFLNESEVLDVPVFVKNGTNYGLIDPKSKTRPVDQMFEILTEANPDEMLEYDDETKPNDEQSVTANVCEIAERFKGNEKDIPYPLNFTDIPAPGLDYSTPSYIRTPACTLLHDLFRGALDVDGRTICTCRKSNIPTCGHSITRDEYFELSTTWRVWQGETMISEPGTITPPHWDSDARATHISCMEGEMGFAWLVRPTKAEHIQWTKDPMKPSGRWAFKVLRAGDSLYMPSGTVHLVVRRPSGTQTLCHSGYATRKQDLVAWLAVLRLEFVNVWDREKAGLEVERRQHRRRLLPLMRQVRKLIGGVRKQGFEKKFGGKKRLADAIKLAGGIEKIVAGFEK